MAAAATPAHDALLSTVAERRDLEPALLVALADRIVALHAGTEAVDSEAARLHTLAAAAPPEIAQALAAELARHAATLDARARSGCIRNACGMRLADIALAGNGPQLLPRPPGAPADLLYDLAGLLGELWRRDLRAAANIVANRYVDIAPQGPAGWALLPLFLALHAESAGEAAQILVPSPPRLIAIGGLSGTGKTTLARQLGARVGRAPGARVLRSDVFRKRIAGLPPETRLAPASYTRRSDEETFAALFESAQDHLAHGSSVILDGVFMSRSEREVAALLAERARVPFAGIWLEAPERDRIARVLARAGDASDAGVEVVREQSRHHIGDLGGWSRMRVNRPLPLIVAAARAILDRTQGRR